MSDLSALCKEFNKKSKSDIVQVGLKKYNLDVIPLSSPRVNYCLYGGIPLGRLIEFYGAEGSGKTTTAIDACANAQKLFEAQNPDNPRQILYIDAENTLDAKWAEKLGLDVSNIVIMKPETQTAEEIFQFVLDAVDTGEVGLVVIDSLGVMLSEQAYDKDLSERTYGGISMALTAFSKKAEMLCHKYNSTIIGINQIRDNLSSPYGGTTTTGGKAWKHNCFGGNTRFITDKGIRRFRDCLDGEQVVVVDKDGNLRDATVHYYGRQKLQKVTLRTPNMKHEVICTPNHRWLLSNGEITENLSIGDSLYYRNENVNFDITTQRQAEMFCLGFAIGDGTDYKSKESIGIRVVLCDRKEEYSKIFEQAKYRSCHQGKYIGYQKLHISKQDFLNGKSWKYLSAEDKRYLFMGYYSADGYYGHSVCGTTDLRVLDFIKDTCSMAGYYLTSVQKTNRTSGFNTKNVFYSVRLTTHTNSYNHWTVESIKPCDTNNVYCVEEPITHTFTLEKGIVTGNCSLRVEFSRGDFFDEKYNRVNQTYENPYGNYVKMSIRKSKCFPNDRKTGQYTLCYYEGIDSITDMVDLAMKIGCITQGGAWFSVLNADTGELIEKYQGRPSLIEAIKTNETIRNPIQAKIEAYISTS